jgi:hypothetical protein
MSTTKQSEGAAWKKTVNTKNGPVEVLSITIGDKRYTAWPNTFKKEGERSPDYRLQVDNYEPKAKTESKSFAGQDLPF